MDSTSILYQDVVDGIRPIFSTTTKPREPACSICKHDYDQAGTGHETILDYFNELPFAARKTFIQHVVEPVTLSCGHTFCTFCTCAWMVQNEPPTCPMCRRTIVIPEKEGDSDHDNDVASADVYVDGLSISLGISTLAAQEIYRILKFSTRQLLTTTTPMPFFYSASAMIVDLPRIMVSVARRFHSRAKGEPPAADLVFLKPHHPMENPVIRLRHGTKDQLKFLARPDAPLAKHLDALAMYDVLCTNIRGIEYMDGDSEVESLKDWDDIVQELLIIVKHKMPDATGGLEKAKWWAYVECVIKAAVVWQAHCECVRELSRSPD